MAKKLTAAELHRLARLGAAARLTQLEREIGALKRAFPGLKPQGPAAGQPPGGADHAGSGSAAARRGRRKPMSAAERKAASDRMKRYWEARRKAAAK